jgi:taurine dioxygenase
MKVVALDAPLGARIEGICWQDATKPDIAAVLNKALGEHLLVVVPGQPMTAPLMRDFASAFGKPRAQLLRYKRNDDVPEVSTMVSTLMADGTTDKTALRSEDWHTDDSYRAVPAKATLLHNMETPSHGGRTWFCNMHSVYEALPEATRRRIDGKRAIHAYDTARARNRPSARTPQEIAETPDVEHPLVRTHPDTGRKCLFVNASYTIGIEGMTAAEGKALLDFLLEHGHRPEFTFRFRWQKGSIAFWDNRSTKHIALGDTGPFRRLMRRVQIGGAGKPV